MKSKKLLSIILTLAMVLSLLPATVSAEDNVAPDYFYIRNIGGGTAEISWRDPILQYKPDEDGTFVDFGGAVTLLPGETCYFKGINESAGQIKCDSGDGRIAIGGDIGTILNGVGHMDEYPEWAFYSFCAGLESLCDISNLTVCREDTVLGAYCFSDMFFGCIRLYKIPEGFLPARTLAESCYRSMFTDCAIKKVPQGLLPATTLAKNCYYGMFMGCNFEIPENFLPATELAPSCYRNMFTRNGTNSITIKSPETLLPAMTLADGCYAYMFNAQDEITVAPTLPAKTLCVDCYRGMFDECTNLSSVKVGFSAWNYDQTYRFLPASVSGTLSLYCPNELDCESRGVHSIPSGLSVIIKNPITVSFDMQGHGTAIAPLNAYTGDTFAMPKIPTEKGYTFDGWYTEKECETLWNFETDIPTGSMTLFAKWLDYESSLVRFCTMGGAGGTELIYARCGMPMPEITTPVKDGFLFAGFYDLNGVKYYNANGTSAKNWDKKDVETCLIADWRAAASLSDITVESGDVLDLDGEEISAAAVFVKDGGKITDSSGGKGILKMPKNALYGRSYTDRLPLYDAENGGWRFFDCEICAGYIEGEDGVVGTTLKFKDAETEAIAKRILASGYSGMSLDIMLSETDKNGAVHKVICEAPQSVIKEYGSDLKKPILMGVSNVTKNTDVSVNYRFINGLTVSKNISAASPCITLEVGADRSYTVRVFGTVVSGTVIVAVYNSKNDKTLVDATVKKVAELSGTVPEGGGFVKSMLWSDLDSAIPICSPAEKVITE